MHLKVYMVAILPYLIIKGLSQQYQLPPVSASSDKYIRLNEIQELHEPDILLEKIYRRQVYKVSSVPSDSESSMLGQFGPCKESPPEVSFKNIGFYHLDQPMNSYSQGQLVSNSTEAPRKSSNIIYDYEVLKDKNQNIVDMLYWDNQIYTIASTGVISVYRLSSDDNGIQLKSTVKGVDWEGLYQYRYQSWMTGEKNEKERLEKIQEMENKKIKKNNSTTVNNKSQTQQKNLNLNNSSLNTTNNTSINSTRTLQEVNFNSPSPKVKTKEENIPNSVQSNQSQQNSTQPLFYTVPAPQQPKAHLQKGYFQFMDNNKLLIFANNDYLIAYDITRNQSILLSEQLQFDYLFLTKNTTVEPKKNVPNNKTNTTNETTNKINAANTTTNTTTNTATNITTNTTTNKTNQTFNSTTNQTFNQTSNQTSNSSNNSTTNTNQTSPVSNQTATISNQTTIISNQTTKNSSQTTINPLTPSKQKDNSTSEKSEPQQPYPEPAPIIPAQYAIISQFQQITKINQTHFVLADRKQGIFIYQITKRKPNNYTYTSNPSNYALRKTAVITKEHFGKSYQENEQMNLVDIAFYNNKSLLLVLDYEKGVFAFQQPLIKTQTNNSQIQQKQPPFVLSSYTIIKKMCNLMEFSEVSQTLYLSCNKIYRISLANWPKITEKIFPHPLINIRQIFVEEERDIFILSGYSVFKVMYLDRTTNYFQDDMLDKIIFNKDFAITANENHIIALKYKVEKPAIYCETRNNSLVGTHNLMLRTTAECSQIYLNSINYTKPQNLPFNENDICVYTVYKNVYIWEQGEVPLKPLAIIMLVFLIFIVVMIIWYVLIKLRMQRVNQHLKYLSEQGHKTLVEEQQPKQTYSQENSSENNETVKYPQTDKKSVQQANSAELDHNKDLYSIQ